MTNPRMQARSGPPSDAGGARLAKISCSPVDHDTTAGPRAEASGAEARPPPKCSGLLNTCSTSKAWHECCSMPHRAVDVGPRAAAPYAKRAPSRFPSPRPCAVWLECLASFFFLSLVFLRLTFLASGDRVSRTVRSVRRPRPRRFPWLELPLSLSGWEPLFILS